MPHVFGLGEHCCQKMERAAVFGESEIDDQT